MYRIYLVVVVLLLTSPTGLARTYFCGSAMLSSYGSETRFRTRYFDEETRRKWWRCIRRIFGRILVVAVIFIDPATDGEVETRKH